MLQDGDHHIKSGTEKQQFVRMEADRSEKDPEGIAPVHRAGAIPSGVTMEVCLKSFQA
jgi:hypothetical protein